MRVLLYYSRYCCTIAGIAVAGIAVAGIAVAGIAVAGIAVAGIAVAGIAVAGIAVAGIDVAVVPQKALPRQVFRPQDALSAVWQRARWRHAICAVLQIGFVFVCNPYFLPQPHFPHFCFCLCDQTVDTVHGHILSKTLCSNNF